VFGGLHVATDDRFGARPALGPAIGMATILDLTAAKA
jgi:hypothetical protein